MNLLIYIIWFDNSGYSILLNKSFIRKMDNRQMYKAEMNEDSLDFSEQKSIQKQSPQDLFEESEYENRDNQNLMMQENPQSYDQKQQVAFMHVNPDQMTDKPQKNDAPNLYDVINDNESDDAEVLNVKKFYKTDVGHDQTVNNQKNDTMEQSVDANYTAGQSALLHKTLANFGTNYFKKNDLQIQPAAFRNNQCMKSSLHTAEENQTIRSFGNSMLEQEGPGLQKSQVEETPKNRKLAGFARDSLRSKLSLIRSRTKSSKVQRKASLLEKSVKSYILDKLSVPEDKQFSSRKESDDEDKDDNEEEDEDFLNTSQSMRAGMSMIRSKVGKQGLKFEDLRGVYIEEYGVQLDFPTYYHHDARFVPHESDYVVTMGFHIIPKASQAVIQTTWIDGRVEENSYDEIYDKTGDSILLTLNRLEGRRGFKPVKQIQLHGVKKSLMKFSKSGKYFGIFQKNDRTLNVFESSDIEKCFDRIARHKHESSSLMSYKIKEDGIQNCKRLIFDLNDQYVALQTLTKILIFSLKPHEIGKLVQEFKINLDSYEAILDIVIDSKNCQDKRYKCMIACKVSKFTQIQMYDIAQPEDFRQISYSKKGAELIVRISDDFQKAVLSNGQEHYMYVEGVGQQVFAKIKDKFLRNAVYDEKGFYLITSKDYDRDIDILSSSDPNFNASVKRSIEPGLLTAFDAIVTTTGDQKCLRTLIKVGDYLYQDTYELDKKNGENADKFLVDTDGNSEDAWERFNQSQQSQAEAPCLSTTVQKFYTGYGFNWPYFSYATANRKVLILNCFNPNFVQRYELPSRVTIILETFLTDTHDCFLIAETEDDTFEIYHINLDSLDPRVSSPIFKYSFDDVDGELLKGFHVRGSSEKEKINLNKSLMVFMQHGSSLYGWRKGDAVLRKIEENVSNMYYLSDDQIFYLKTKEIEIKGKQKVEHSRIMTLEAQFGNYATSEIYQDRDIRAEILNFGVDNTKKRLIILTGVKNQRNKRDKVITLYDLESEKILTDIQVKNREIIGRLKSNLYNFVGGHIYYRNKVIKIRYDILERPKAAELTEDQLFDHYSDILQLNNPNSIVQSGTPLQTCMYNRLAYIIRNQKELKPRKILVMPYLHERKIILNRRHSANQFYSIIEDGPQKYIYCMQLDNEKIYIYTDTGILVQRLLYDKLAQECGKPQELSENAQYFVFRKGDYNVEISIVHMTIDGLEKISQYNIKKILSEYLMKWHEQQQLIKKQEMGPAEKPKAHRRNSLRQKLSELSKGNEHLLFWEKYLGQLDDMSKVKISFCMNDNGDVLVRVAPTATWYEKVEKELKDLQVFTDLQSADDESVIPEQCSFFLYIANEKKSKNSIYVYFDSTTDEIDNLQGVSMNTQYIFFWNPGKVWKLSLETKKLDRLNFYVSEKEVQTYVKQVKTGSNENLVCLRVSQSPKLDCIIIWDLEKDLEKEFFDVESDAIFFQDKAGNPFLAENNNITNCSQGCRLKCYQTSVKDFERASFGYEYGHRVAFDTHNYIIFRNFINLSFSYMTFVIKDNFDRCGYVRDDYLFDIEGYDYILKKKNLFFEGDLVKFQYEKLNFILKNYQELDPILLESLQYKNEEIDQIPLHLALEANNHRMVNLILNNMSKIDYAAVNLIKDIFEQLVTFGDFECYLRQSPFQTEQMINKQTLRLYPSEQEDEEIIIVRPSQTSYIDGEYFKDVVKEREPSDKNAQTFAVDIVCVRVDWIINEDQGRVFLNELLKEERKDIFTSKYVQIIVQYLYNNFKNNIYANLLPFYLLNMFLTIVLIIFGANFFPKELSIELIKNPEMNLRNNEEIGKFFKNLTASNILTSFGQLSAAKDEDDDDFDVVWFNSIRSIIIVLMNIPNLKNIHIFFRTSRSLGMATTLTRGWSLIDLVIIVCDIMLTLSLFIHMDEMTLRIVEAMLIVFLMSKSLYFLRLNGDIAPLVDIIFVILGDIQYFMVIFLICQSAFISAFFCIGRYQMLNQMAKLEDQDDEDYAPPSYSTFTGAIDHVYQSSLGGFTTKEYYGDPTTPFLLILFLGLSFFMCIHLLNMLIAIMGDSFSQNNEVKEAKKKISQLQFVVENWWLDPIKDKEKNVYLVAAFSVQDNTDEMERIEKLSDKVDLSLEKLNGIMKEIKRGQQQQNIMFNQYRK